ncbi:TonB-dependent receptor plug domain-containing protein [Sphingomonas sp. LHG3443-2]|uniref:TonB-dependent receptor plug domain-containing protein n=1 Tax=Sphingomonas sp. LHG3443-2 TaxID=2804639 RepID=UPI003CE6D326
MRSRFHKAGLLGFASLAALSAPALAQEAAPATGDAPPPVSAPAGSKRVFTPADFTRFAPRTALDMLNQVPGFSIRGEDTSSRGLGQASGNVLLNGERISGKSTDPVTALQAIPAGNVTRIEIVDAAEVDVPGLTGQVANVVYEAKKKVGGQFTYRPEFRAHYADPLYTRGDVSVSGTTGPLEYTVSLKNDASRSSAGGPTIITRGDGSLFETREDSWTGNFDQPQISGQFKLDGPGSSLGNLNLLARRFNYRFDEISRRDRAVGPDLERELSQDEKGYNYEAGADYEFALVGGRLKLIGLARSSDEPFVQSALLTYNDLSPRIGSRYVQDGKSKELIGRSEYRWKWGKTDIQLSGEAAFNSLDLVSKLYALQPDGSYAEELFPSGTGKVSEDRYEALVTVGRPLSSKLSVQLVAGGEWSTIVQEGAGGKSRSFFRPKGSLNFAAQVTPTFNANFKIIRRVGQLDFGQFLARVFLDNDNQNAGNPDLVPSQQWRFELELAKDLGRYGKTRVNLVAALFEDYVDIIPIGLTGESPGNIDKARAYAIDWNSTFQLDPLGIKGARINLRGLVQFSSIRDPLTGEKRQLSSFTDRLIEADFRHDIPGSDWAYGVNGSYSHVTRAFRLNEVGRQWEGPVWLGAFVENKDVFGLTVRASAGNLLNARSRWDRIVYTGRRNSAPIDYIENRNRLIGPIFALSVKGTF